MLLLRKQTNYKTVSNVLLSFVKMYCVHCSVDVTRLWISPSTSLCMAGCTLLSHQGYRQWYARCVCLSVRVLVCLSVCVLVCVSVYMHACTWYTEQAWRRSREHNRPFIKLRMFDMVNLLHTCAIDLEITCPIKSIQSSDTTCISSTVLLSQHNHLQHPG